jgi:hypothetical protein
MNILIEALLFSDFLGPVLIHGIRLILIMMRSGTSPSLTLAKTMIG